MSVCPSEKPAGDLVEDSARDQVLVAGDIAEDTGVLRFQRASFHGLEAQAAEAGRTKVDEAALAMAIDEAPQPFEGGRGGDDSGGGSDNASKRGIPA